MESGNPAKWEDDRTSEGAEDGADARNCISTSSSASTEIDDSSKTTAMVLAKEEKKEEQFVESGKHDSENRAGIESESAMEGSCVLQSPPTLELEDWIRDEPICCMPLADQNSIHESNTLMIPPDLDMDGSCNVSSTSQETGKEMLQDMMNFSNGGLGRDSAHLARSSSISRGMFPDLKKIIVKKPILDKAVERLGGGRKGALMLWKVIQVWLSHQKKSDMPDLEALGSPCFRPEQWISQDTVGGSENCFDSFGNQGMIQPGLDGVHFPDAGYVGVSQNCIDGQIIHPAEQNNSYQAYQQASMAAYQEGGGNPSGYSGFAAEYNNLNPQMRSRHQMIPVHHQQDMENGQQILQNAAMAGLAPMDAINMGSWNPAATTRAARRSRMARQRRMAQHHHARLAASHNISMPMSWSPYMSYAAMPEQQGHQGPLTYPREAKVRNSEKQLKFLFQKELKPSDVGNLGRVVLPKKEAEMHLPSLSAREGMALPMEDMTTGHVWHFKYRFWPNNKSRMYLLENTGEFVRSHHLQEGDLMRIYRDPRTAKYVINGTKSGKVDVTTAGACVKSLKRRVAKEEESMSGLTSTSSGTDSGNADSLRDNACTMSTAMLGSLHSSNEGNITNVMHEFSNDSRFDPSSLPQLERFPSFEIGDMMIDEIFGFVDTPEAETTSRKSDVAVEN